MKQKPILSIILMSLLMLMLNISSAQAQGPQQPATFWGIVTVNGSPVPPGTGVTAWIAGTQSGQDITRTVSGQSWYSIDVTPGNPGDTVEFQVDGQAANETGEWELGASVELNLTVTDGGPTPPPITPIVTVTPPPVTGNCATPRPNSSDPACASATIEGSLWATWQNILFPSASVTGEDVIVETADQTWRAADSTRNNSGWHVTLHATGDFADGDGNTIPISGFNVWCTDVSTVNGHNSTPPTCQVSEPGSPLTGQVNLLAAADGTGRGIYDFIPHFRLFVPGTTLAGDYLTTVEVTIVAGP